MIGDHALPTYASLLVVQVKEAGAIEFLEARGPLYSLERALTESILGEC